jgi:malate dehydrogenase
MERGDLLKENGAIFIGQGRAINDHAASDVRVAVVGNPCNTNAMSALRTAKDIPRERFSAMTRLVQNRAQALLARRAKVQVADVKNVLIWGNHSATQVPDYVHATIGGKPAADVIKDEAWLKGDFFTTVQKRGAAIIAARGLSSAMSAANALTDHVRDLCTATPAGAWNSVCVCSDGSYDVPEGLISSFPVQADGKGGHKIVQGLELDPFLRGKLDASVKELVEERDAVAGMIG